MSKAQRKNDQLKRGIKFAKVSLGDTEVITFSSGVTGLYCFVLQGGGIEHNGRFEFKTEMDAYKAALEYFVASSAARN